MVPELLSFLENTSSLQELSLLDNFVKENGSKTTIPQLTGLTMKQRFSSALFKHISDPSVDEPVLNQLLIVVKIISRDKEDLRKVFMDDKLIILVERAKLTGGAPVDYNDLKPSAIEAVKCLCNLLINCNEAANALRDLGMTKPLMQRIKLNISSQSVDAKLFDLKLIFLVTAICKSTNSELFDEFSGLQPFLELLETELKVNGHGKNVSSFKISSETLKIVFNVLASLNLDESDSVCAKEELQNLVIILRNILVMSGENCSTLHSDAINLLTLVPAEHLVAIEVPSSTTRGVVTLEDPRYLAVSKMLDFLDDLLSTTKGPRNEASPVILVLYRLCQAKKEFRKYIRLRILPKLTKKEVFTRPEDGDSLRNKLCRLLTSVNSEFVADFLFLLCKENARKMVKYFGYGHAAGLFARRGLMGMTAGDTSDSESESEDYAQYKHLVNPVVGCHTPSHVGPTEQMSEEQKEYLAMELVKSIDKLQRGGVIQPCKIGEDGKPHPIQHVQELQNAVENDSSDSED